jgi:EAL domain-containing protein (putative c-di-GMP-specific phosphodiesterase class I)
MANQHRALEGPRVLLVDDDEIVLQTYARVLTGNGYGVETVTNGPAALRAIRWNSFDIVLSEIDMRRMNGIQLVDRVRAADPELPVILMTRIPSVEVMALAAEQGAFRCLMKPVESAMLVKVIDCTVRHSRSTREKRLAAGRPGSSVTRSADARTSLVAAFDRAFESLYLVYQPIVSWSHRGVIAYEARVRSQEPEMQDAPTIFDAAERLGRLHHVGRKIRSRALEPLTRLPPEAVLFVHLHPSDLFDDDLFAPDAPLTTVARRIVLEIAERDYLRGIRDVETRVADLRRAGFRIAIADLGNHAPSASLGPLDPKFVKLDIALVRDLHLEPRKQALVRKINAMCVERDRTLIGEGIEKREERDELASIGCDLMQGYLFARPSAAFPVPAF